MLTCVKTQFKGSSREMEQQVTQHENGTLNKLSNVNARLKKNIVFCFVLKKLVQYIISFPLIQNR